MFSTKDFVPDSMKYNVVYKFSCVSCNASYINETTRPFTTRIKEHLGTDKSSQILKHRLRWIEKTCVMKIPFLF